MSAIEPALLPESCQDRNWRSLLANRKNEGICALLVDDRLMRFQTGPNFRHGFRKNIIIGTNLLSQPDTIAESQLRPSGITQLLGASLHFLDIGLEIWDSKDQLVFYNEKINQLQAGFHTPAHISQSFENLLCEKLNRRLIKTGSESEELWLAKNLANRGKNITPVLYELIDDRWANIHETYTPDGFLVVTWVDVTDLVRKGRVLEAINQQLALQSTTDDLTGLANRRRLDQVMATEWQPSRLRATPLSLLMVDIDYFKKYNDYYGHPAGDECLRKVAKILDQCARRTGDLVARYGGEEFVLFLPGSDLNRARETAQKCLDLMSAQAIPHVNSPLCSRVTLSIGVACLLPEIHLDASLVLNAADAALYRAKSNGRTRYEVADEKDWTIKKDTPRNALSNDIPGQALTSFTITHPATVRNLRRKDDIPEEIHNWN
jgi:diguanylate cyclase (GGDEF)-like protein